MFKYLTLCTALALGTQVQAANEQTQAAMPSHLASQNLLTDIVNNQGRLVAVGERGHIIYSDDGETWRQANVPVNVLLTAIDFVDDQIGFAVGHDAVLLKTTDGGLNWQVINHQPELDKPLLNVKVFGQQVIAVGAYGLYWQSIDAGTTWTSEFQDELLIEDDRLYLEDLKQFEPEAYDDEKQFMLPHFNDIAKAGDDLIIVGEAGFVASSANAGKDWQQIETQYYGSYFSAIDSPQGVQLAGLRGSLYASPSLDGDWQRLPTPVAATINDSYQAANVVYHYANSGNVFFAKGVSPYQLYTFADGKAVMSGVIKDKTMYFATEAGIKSRLVSQIMQGQK